jgi:predicted dienelactone hydrolase
MRVRHLLVLVVILLLHSHAYAGPGFRLLQAPDPGSKDITFGLWYPTAVAAPDAPNTRFGHALAVDAPFTQTRHPLVLLSHGYSGWYGGHADLAMALANAGYLVAAPSHTGNHFADMSSSVDQWAVDRPRHISATLDFLLQYDLTRDVIDASRIGVYGFSAGGFTALSLIGAVPDFDHASEQCQESPSEFVCAEGMIDVMLNAKVDALPASAWGHDPRIRAAAIAAPGLAFAYSEESLADVSVPVQLWSAMNDHSVPHESNALPLSERLPSPVETHWVDNASHFAFIIIPCRPAFEKADPEEYKMVCGDADGFNRREFLQSMAKDMIRFFDESL